MQYISKSSWLGLALDLKELMMASVLRRVNFEQRNTQSVCRSLLEQLAEAHDQLFREIENMEAIVRELRPEENTLANARWQLRV